MFEKPELFWFFIGLGLLLAELIIPGFFIFFFGLGAWITALVCLIWEPSVNVQIVIFGVTSVLSLVALRRMIQKKFFYHDSKDSEDVEDEFTGKEAVAANDFGPDHMGKVQFKGTTWMSESSSRIKEGQRVIIVEKDNFKLIVEPKTN
ncbi:MAG TPA: NfeD family protein [Bacteroidales bacterium]|nr:NfeD family protein [Bacteroidales bacterium]